MRPTLLIPFLFLVIAPLAVLAWLGLRLARDEQEMVQHRFGELIQVRLADLDGRIGQVVERAERELGQTLEQLEGRDPEALRQAVRHTRLVRQIFALDAQGVLVHPRPGGVLSQTEEQFLIRTARLWDEKQPFYRPKRDDAAAERDSDWHVWYWERGLNLIYWRRGGQGEVIGAEVERNALLAELVGELPDTAADPAKPTPGGRVLLVDGNGEPVYNWGSHEPATGALPRFTRTLAPPLGAWRLQYFPAPGELDAELGQAVVWGASAGFGALALAVVGLAIYIFRESGRQMREAAQRVNFVNQVSHELKTPLTNIRMYAELLEDGLEDEEDKLRGQAQVIAQESQRLSRLIGNVLSFARQQRGKLTARRQPGKVDDVVRQVLDQFGPSLEDKGIEVELETGAPAEVLLDSDVVGQILGNLLGNVEKYAAQGGRVEIRTAQKEGQSEIWVTDHGPGVPTRARDKIFKPFFRLSGKVTDGVSGTGIGLAIAQDLARLHGGELSLEPRQVGACFKVSLSTPAKEKGGER